MHDFIYGFLLSAALIIAIGAQNVFVLRKGLAKDNVFFVCLTCFVCDFLLFSSGVMGAGIFFRSNDDLLYIVSVAASIFLTAYGLLSLRRACIGNYESVVIGNSISDNSALKTISATLAITLLNPHVYLDTIVVAGGVAANLNTSQKVSFLFGALIASFLWFFSLGYGARFLLPVFKIKKSWVIFDTFIGFFMLFLALQVFISAN